MKIFSFSVLFVLAGLMLAAQDAIPNPGFEQWVNHGTYAVPVAWNTLNPVTVITDSITCTQDSTTVHSGSYSVRLVSKYISLAGQVVPGVITNGDIDISNASVSGGMVFHSRPTQVNGWYQYYWPSGGDTGAAQVQMISGSNVVGVGYFLFNDSTSTWTPFTVNIQYSSSVIPDTFQIVLLSSVSNNSLPQTTLLLDDLSFSGFPVDQCGTTKTLTQTSGLCNADTLQVWGGSSAAQIVWGLNGAVDVTTQSVPPVYGTTVAGSAAGVSGVAANQLNQPGSIVFDAAGNLYASDYNNNRVQKFAPGDTQGVTVAGDPAGNAGPTAGFLNGPTGIAIDANGNLLVVDQFNSRVQKWAPGATAGVTVAGDSAGNSGISDSLLNYPEGLWLDAAQNLYIADASNNRVQKWAPGAAYGVTVAGSATGNSGTADSLLNLPVGVFVDQAGNLFVSDNANNRVQKWAPGATAGVTVAGDSAGNAGAGAASFTGTSGIFIDVNGNLFVTDRGNQRIQRWAPGDTSGVTVAGVTGTQGTSDSLLHNPTSVWVDSVGTMYIADNHNNRVQRWGSSINTNFVITTPGTYVAVVTAYNGCIDTTNVSVADSLPHPVVTVNQNTLSTTNNYSSYQWYLNGTPITSTGSSYTAIQTGYYQVSVTNANGCGDTSVSQLVVISGINEITVPQINIYPNPTEGLLNLQLSNLDGLTTCELRDELGRVLYTQHTSAGSFTGQINLADYASGIYLLVIRNANMATITKRIVKN